MKCDRRWWNDGRVQLEQKHEPGAKFYVPQTHYLAVFERPAVEPFVDLELARRTRQRRRG